MVEYIDREAIFKAYMDLCYAKSRLAKANGGGAGALVGDNLYPEVEPTMKEVFRMIMAMPAADVVKVVKEKPQTHADRIRAMSDEGIAKHFAAMFVEQKKLDAVESGKGLSHTLCGVLEDAFYSMLLRHLKQPVKDGE